MTAGALLGEPLRPYGFPGRRASGVRPQDRTASSTQVRHLGEAPLYEGEDPLGSAVPHLLSETLRERR